MIFRLVAHLVVVSCRHMHFGIPWLRANQLFLLEPPTAEAKAQAATSKDRGFMHAKDDLQCLQNFASSYSKFERLIHASPPIPSSFSSKPTFSSSFESLQAKRWLLHALWPLEPGQLVSFLSAS